MKAKHTLLFGLLFTLGAKLNAQDDYTGPGARDYEKNPAKNALFIELAGNGGLYSLNAERIYYYGEKLKLAVRGGFAPHFNGIYIEQVYVLENNFILFSNPHHLEFGLGATLERRYNERPGQPDNYFWENLLFGVGRCGYRYQKHDDGFFLRAALTPVFLSKDAEGFHPNYFQFWAGVSVGVSF